MRILNPVNYALSVLSKASVVLVIGFAVLSSRANSDELLQVSDLPAVYRSIGELAGRGTFYAVGERFSFRIDDATITMATLAQGCGHKKRRECERKGLCTVSTTVP